MEDLGQSELIEIRSDREVVGEFTLRELSSLDKEDKACTTDQSYSLTECLLNYAEKESLCVLDIRRSNISRNRESCPTNRLMNLLNVLLWIKNSSWQDLVTRTGCLAKAVFYKYR